MAAYAALVSLMYITEQIKNHPCPPISLDQTQVESLTAKVTFLQEFLEGYSHVGYSREADGLESRIADAAYAAEDIIESRIVDQIRAGSTSHGEEISSGKHISSDEELSTGNNISWLRPYAEKGVIEPEIDYQIVGGSASDGEKISSFDLYEGLQKVIEDMDSIKKEVIRQKQRKIKKEVKDIMEKTGIQHQRNSTPAGSLRSSSKGQNTMVGLHDSLKDQIMDKLSGAELDRQIISIVGMGGIGKTTLARNIYVNQFIVEHFDILTWATISHNYSLREILLEVICQVIEKRRESLSQKSEHELGEMLYKHLLGRRYLIIMDDIWDVQVWDQLKFFFPVNENGSRILITTRQSTVSFQLTDQTHGFKMNPLNEDKSWDLLCKTVFGEEVCPLELKEIGKKIAKNCKGLPLSIVVIGRVLARSKQTKEYWEYIAENLSSIVYSEDDEYCLKILSTSYDQLPVHLKPCFLYLGVFCEDDKIDVSFLIRLWVAEGFLKPIRDKNLEETAEEYVEDLIDRNLIFIHKRESNGKIESCKIHDLLRDLCLRKAEKEKFLCVASQLTVGIPQSMNTQRRISFYRSTSREALKSLQTASLVRSFICDFDVSLPSFNFRLLRVLFTSETRFVDSLEATFFQLINLRYLYIRFRSWRDSRLFLSSLHLLWNLHTLIIPNSRINFIAPPEIWKMTQLRHVEVWSLELPDPPNGYTDGRESRDDIVLGNLHTLMNVNNFKCGGEVVKRIPHIKTLHVNYDGVEGWSLSCFDNLDLLKLESLKCFFYPRTNRNDVLPSKKKKAMIDVLPSKKKKTMIDVPQNLTFPHSLRRLTLGGCQLRWEDITTKIGSLPLLEVLKLEFVAIRGPKWETVEEGFPNLKFLEIVSYDNDLECWMMTDSTHFPVLEHVVLRGLEKLESIPSELGNIPTLKSIDLKNCSDSAFISAKKMLDEQEDYGNLDLQVRVTIWTEDAEILSLASGNFQVEVEEL